VISTRPRTSFIACPEAPRHRHTAVMFVDLDHFMRICMDAPPEAVFGLLGDFQHVVTNLASSFGGELSSYQGDGVLVTFGDATGRADCATRALRCAREILEQIRALSFDHANARTSSISASIGLQYGSIWSSTLAASRSFGPTLIGDAVNVAARLEKQAQALGTKIVVGDDLIQRAWRGSASPSDLAHFVNVGPLFVRGRHTSVHVWKLRSQSSELLLEDASTDNVDADMWRDPITPCPCAQA
jgi:adenylate cyclase